MKKTVVYLLVGCLAYCCATTQIEGFKYIKYTSEFQTSSVEKPFKVKTYTMFIPKGFTIDKEDFNPEYKEVVYNYPNSIKVYITDNTLGGSSLNGDNKLDKGITTIRRENMQDSIYMSGQQKDNKYWKENILNDIVVGYLNVPENRKEEFDKAMASLKNDRDDSKRALLHEAIHTQKQ